MHSYTLAGLTLSVPFTLPGFPGPRACDVSVRQGPVPRSLPDSPFAGGYFQAAPGVLLFQPGDGCRFLVRHGREVVYEAEPECSTDLLRMHLLQSVLGALLQQRGTLPLHASAVRVGGRAIALLGQSEAGKSTLAVLLHLAGHSFLTDDICPVLLKPAPVIAGGCPYLKLHRETVRRLGLSEFPQEPPELADRGRTRVLLRREPPEPVSLGRVYLLSPSEEAGIRMEDLAPPLVLRTLLVHTYRRQYIAGLGLREAQFAACARLAAAAGLREVRYPRSPEIYPDLAEAILRDCSRPAPPEDPPMRSPGPEAAA